MDHKQEIVSNDNNPQRENHSEESGPVPGEIERLSDAIDSTTNNEETQLKDEISTVLQDEETHINSTNETSSVKQDKQMPTSNNQLSKSSTTLNLGKNFTTRMCPKTIISSVSLGGESSISSEGETFSIGESIQQQFFKTPSSRIGSRKRKFDDSLDSEIVNLFECIHEKSESRPASTSTKRTNSQILVDDALKWLTGLRSCKTRKTSQRKPLSKSRKRTPQNFPDDE
ncbi:hypothetical protein LSTR_LSTR002376 [Laodelphax striatellus]|uniref:Uncharacterized protein n=1 Tax=Laodelphax striatellus TaxID=195883 RepID=A0A482X2M3_LAOST|nr:hypothetical protein LSTR_LSTR002376 [Laodelphax striatellus]